jgi:transcriptional regulator GlxA family with amidase domain
VFNAANEVLAAARPRSTPYRTAIVSLAGGSVASESGMAFVTVRRDHASRPDTLIVPGGNGVRDAVRDPDLVTLVAELGRASRRVASVCSGAFLTAAAGLANGRRVTTHWARADALQRAHPEITVDADPIYIRDGDLWSSAGVTAGIDLALAMVEDDHDAQVAQIVARWLVMFLRRPGGQSQFATPVWSDAAATPPIRAAQVLIDTDPGADHRVGLLADRVGMSERHFTRRFADETGISPAQYVARVRVEAARRSLEATDDKVDAIATRCGFGTAETMRRTFTRRLGVSPDQYRRRFRSTP